jgi:hypothetical protein
MRFGKCWWCANWGTPPLPPCLFEFIELQAKTAKNYEFKGVKVKNLESRGVSGCLNSMPFLLECSYDLLSAHNLNNLSLTTHTATLGYSSIITPDVN